MLRCLLGGLPSLSLDWKRESDTFRASHRIAEIGILRIGQQSLALVLSVVLDSTTRIRAFRAVTLVLGVSENCGQSGERPIGHIGPMLHAEVKLRDLRARYVGDLETP